MDHIIFIQKAKENLAAAKVCYSNNYYNACANRLYYAMFQIAVAVLIYKGFPPTQGSIGHEWTQSTFARELINRQKAIAGRFRAYLYDAQSLRNTADYYESGVSKKSVERQLKKAEEFVTALQLEVKSP